MKTSQAKTPASSSEIKPILYSRGQVQQMLGGVSRHTVWRLEKAGKLKPVRLNPQTPQARVFYRHSEVMELIGNEAGQ